MFLNVCVYNMKERKEWPPCKPEEIPTASPLYIAPSSRIPTPQLSMNLHNPQPQNPNPQVYIPQNPNPHYPNSQTLQQNPFSVPQITVSQNLNPGPQMLSQNPGPQITYQNPEHQMICQNLGPQMSTQNPGPQMTYQNPEPQMSYQNPSSQINIQIPTGQNPAPQKNPYQNPAPQQNPHQNLASQNITPQNTPAIRTSETKQSKSQMEEFTSESNASMEMSNISNAALQHQMSIFSAEVTNITGRRSVMECVETISDSIDTQILVSNVTKERPKSPPPIHRKESVYETQDISVIVSTNKPEKMVDHPVVKVEDTSKNINIEDVSASCGKVCNPQIRGNNPCPQVATCPMNNPECQVSVVTCPQNMEQCPLNKSTELSSSLINSVPKEYISPMVKALTIASDRPFNTVSFTIKSKEYDTKAGSKESVEARSMQSTKSESKRLIESQTTQMSKTESKKLMESQALQMSKTESKKMAESQAMQMSKMESKKMSESQNIQSTKAETKKISFPHVQVSALTSALTIAPSTPFTPSAQISMDPVSLPEESVPYFPPEIPITVKQSKVQKPVITCKSPFVQALTTAPERPYSPMVIGVGAGQEQSEVPDFMKDVPKPPKQKLSMLSALTTASERPFTPALSISSIGEGQEYRTDPIIVEPPKPEPRKIESTPLVVKPASHMVPSPSAFRPIGNASKPFKPISQSYKPQQEVIPKPVTSFPPVSDELKCNYTSGMAVNYSLPSQNATTQGFKMQTQSTQMSNSARQEISQYANVSQKEEINKQQQFSSRKTSSGLQSATNIPGYQKNINEKLYEQEMYAPPQIPKPIQPVQKPVTTLQPGQYQPNALHTTFKPVYEENQSHYLRSVSPSMINKAAPALPYYQADLVAHECLAVESNVLDPRSPAVSRSPSPMPGRSSSPFPRTMAKSPAAGPPPNPLADRYPKPVVVKDERYLEAKENLTSYIPKNQGRVDQLKNKLTMEQPAQPPKSFYGQSQMVSRQAQVQTGQSQLLGGQAQMSKQSDTYQNVQMSQRAMQQESQNYKRSEIENIRHMEQLNQSKMQSIETSADNRIQIQRTKRCTEEFERTQKSKTIEIQRSGAGITQTSQNMSLSGGSYQGQGFQKQIAPPQPTNFQSGPARIPQNKNIPTPVPVPASSQQSRSFSLPGSTASIPKQYKPSPLAASGPSIAPAGNQSASRPNVPQPYAGAVGGRQGGAIAVGPKRGRGILNLSSGPGSRVPLCGHCNSHIRGPFITALGKIWCPEHFVCTTPSCRRPLQDMGFVEERGQLYCEYCYEQYLAPVCAKCNTKIKGDCLNAIGKHFHPECFTCAYCSKLFGNSPFFLEDALPYCEADWNELFTTKCFACGFPVEAGDRWVEALSNNYHSQCFNCTMCKKNLEGQSFYAKGGRPFCKNHAR